MELGTRGEVSVVVGEQDTAEAVGSGDVPVLGTPRLVALAEAATVRALDLPDGQTSVGIRVELFHRAASHPGTRVDVAAELTAVNGKRLTFEVRAVDEHGVTVGNGTVERVVVDRAGFLKR